MSLAAIRARLQAQENKSQQNQTASTGDNAIYPFWNMAIGQSATLRFLPDGDPKNEFFWVERAMIRLPFPGVKGMHDKEVTVQVPCMEMYDENCPILSEVRTWYKDESLKETANKYWKKRTYLFQGFVRQNPLNDDKVPENPIRRFVISPQIFQIIKSSLLDPELDEIPTDFQRGLNFNINKTSSGEYAGYNTSAWARKESALSRDDLDVIEKHGLFNLRDFLPKRPSDAEQRVIRELFEASVDGNPYDPDKWSAYYKPWGLNITPSNRADDGEVAPPRQAPRVVQAPVAEKEVPSSAPWTDDEEQDAPVVADSKPSAESTGSSKTNDILAMIRARQQKQ